ncbi:MAG: deoxyguanosinetriphosphate triphosphohydrolase [Chloroflexi bacterium]|nr:deoxyguanosinetriphosphate triphosphohydrolase [Chloroflexota bacterium]
MSAAFRQRVHPEVRERLEQEEVRCLSPFAAPSANAGGRLRDEPPDPMRLAYQRDRDRIIHSKAFRRLKHKTQVFIAPQGDHYRTRLTHTVEVMQVSRSIARALRLNEDLTEAIALGHDLGHTPFGHAGEDAMAELLPGGFRHNEQSVRVVEYLEKDGRGLNLTHAVKDGVLKHSKVRRSVADLGWGFAETLEGQVVKISDSLAYVTHDIDDALRAGVLRESDIPTELVEAFGRRSSQRINAFITDIVDYNWSVALGRGSQWQEAVGNGQFLTMSPGALEMFNALREFMFANVYTQSAAKADIPKTRFVIHALFEHFTKRPDELPPEPRENARREPVERRVADYIAGMTDRVAINAFERLYVPRQWAVLGDGRASGDGE